MKFLVIVNESPWGTDLALAAYRFVSAAVESRVEVSSVFFREDGVYNALKGENSDPGTPDLADAWGELAKKSATRLLVCSSSWARRATTEHSAGFEISGLAEMMELMLDSDRVVTF